MTKAEQVHKLGKERVSANDIAQRMGIGFKEVIHLMQSKPKKTFNEAGKPIRVWK